MFSMICRELFGQMRRFGYTRNPEDDICMQFAMELRQLQMLGLTEAFVWTHVANEWAGKNRWAFGAAQKAKGKISGWPDYIFMHTHGGLAIEFKDEKGEQSDNQILVERWFDSARVPYYVCRSAEEAMDLLREFELVFEGGV